MGVMISVIWIYFVLGVFWAILFIVKGINCYGRAHIIGLFWVSVLLIIFWPIILILEDDL